MHSAMHDAAARGGLRAPPRPRLHTCPPSRARQAARRIISEWPALDDEVAAFTGEMDAK